MKLYDSSLSTIVEEGHSIKLTTIASSKMLERIFILLLGTVNSIMLSGYSQDAVAIANISNQIINFCIMLPDMVVIGANICMSLAFGRNNRPLAGKISATASVADVVLSLFLSVFVILFAKPLLLLMNTEAQLLEAAIGYLRIIAAFLPVTALMTCFNNFLICNGYSAYTLGIGILYNLLNVLFCYVVLYMPVNLPVSSISAVAFAGRIACLIGLFAAIGVFGWKKCPYHFGIFPPQLKHVLKVGIPGGMNGFSYQFAQLVTTGLIASFGVETISTKVYISNIILFSSAIGSAVGNGGGILIGRYRGRRDFDAIQRLFRQNLLIAIAGNILVSVIVFLLHVPLMGLFSANDQAVAMAGKIMLIDIAVQIFRAVNNVSDQALNANGDVRTTLLISVAACWLFSVLMSYLLGVKLGLGLIGVWIAFMLDEGFKAILHLLRWKSGNWKYIQC